MIALLSSCSGKEIPMQKFEGKVVEKLSALEQEFLINKLSFGFDFPGAKCFLGDFDIMEEDSKVLKYDEFLVTVERLDKSEKEPLFSKKIKRDQFKIDSVKSSLFSSFSDNSGVYGVFICTDNTKVNSCKNKKFIQYEPYTYFLFSEKSDKSKISFDKNFYFKPISIINNNIYKFNSIELSENNLNFLRYSLKFDKNKSKKIMSILVGLNKKLLNFDSEVKKNMVLELKLAKIDPICNVKKLKDHFYNLNPKSPESFQ